MKYKDGVYSEVTAFRNNKKIKISISEKMQHALDVADALSKQIVGKEIIITSILDGGHGDDSKHYSGDAADIRRWIYKSQKLDSMLANLKDNLGPDYDIVLESTHIHIEYDPKPVK